MHENYDKNKESPYFKYWNINSLYGWAVPKNDFKYVEKISQFNKDFIKRYNNGINDGYFL